MLTHEQLRRVFGPGPAAPEHRARLSTRVFVQTPTGLAFEGPGVEGRRLTAWEVWATPALRALLPVLADEGFAPLPLASSWPPIAARAARLRLDLPGDGVKALGLKATRVAALEQGRGPVREVEALALRLGMPAGTLADGDDALATRLRTLREDRPGSLKPRVVQAFAEAGGIIATERRLLASLGMLPAFELPAPSADFGGAGRPAWEAGYELAHRTRDLLGLMPDEPIENLHALIEDRLGILVIQDELPAWLAGATVAVGELRGIVVNTVGSNQNVWVRRATMAHELGHLLWDPAERLQSLTFDRHQDLDRPERANDVVEQRANAFAIELLAPQAALQSIAAASPDRSVALRAIMERFGLSRTAASYHLWNALDRSFDRRSLQADPEPTDDWTGRESYSVEFFRPAATPLRRRGRFAATVAAAARTGLIHRDAAALLLGVEAVSARDLQGIAELFPQHVEAAEARVAAARAAIPDARSRPDGGLDHAWMRAHAAAYAGRWVALSGGQLLAAGQSLAEVEAKLSGRDGARPLIFQVGPEARSAG
ncbi:MAG: ImmA/IrrE family metallo-endopeptidase [bacterium]